ncbi:MAG: hypothetical protein ACI9BD_000737 [Candidatus Marinamargulisbacteria bacterium]|jgi:hypothetical protein
MVYNTLVKLIRKHLFIISNEKFRSENNSLVLERYIAKHPLLKPEFFVVNDQVHGFKKTSKRISSLEKFPIFVEIESIYDADMDETLVDSMDLYVEAKINPEIILEDIQYLAGIYSKTIMIDRVARINDESQASLMVYSKLNDLFLNHFFEEEMEDGSMSESEFSMMIEVNLVSFVNFVKILDDVIKGKKLSKLEHIFDPDAS